MVVLSRPLNALSLEFALQDLPTADLRKHLSSLTRSELETLLHDWSFLARPEQRPPEMMETINEPWQNWLYLAGRGAGKTRSGAEWVRDKVKSGSKLGALIAPTNSDIRKVMIEGSSGILSCGFEGDVDTNGDAMGVPTYHPSLGNLLTWKNGARVNAFSAEEPDRLRGPQHEFIWADELAAWRNPQEAWDMAMFGLRLGLHPQAMISTTPRPIPILRELMRSPYTHVTRSSTFANRANLAKAFFDRTVAKYMGTRMGRQELMAELLEEMEGALWNRDTIDKAALGLRSLPIFKRIVIAIDPAITENPTSNLTGIVAAALGVDNRGYILADRSGRFSPDAWARIAIAMYDDLKADRIVAEGNQGGDMVRHTIATVRPNAPITIVHASRSKQARAEPVAALYEQGRIIHVEAFTELEDQMCTWEPLTGDPSPDRLDAMVWAITNLMLGAQVVPIVLPFSTGSPRCIPGQ